MLNVVMFNGGRGAAYIIPELVREENLHLTSIVNAYDDLLSNDALGETLQQFTASNFVMANLHIWVLVLGFIGMILLILDLLFPIV